MPFPAVTFPMQLPAQVRRELEALLAQLNEGYLLVEHKDDGTHGNITSDTVTSDALYLRSPDSDALIKFYAGGDASVVLQQGESSTLASLEVNNLSADVLLLTQFIQITDDAPSIRWYEADASAGNHYWYAVADGETWELQALDDGGAVTATAIGVARDGTVTVPTIVLGAATASGAKFFLDGAGIVGLYLGSGGAYAALNLRYVAATENVFIPDGLSNAPSLAFTSDQNTGFYRPTTDSIGFSVGGLGGFTFSPTTGGVGYMLTVNAGAFGTGAIAGARLLIGRNTSGSGAAGSFSLQRLGGTIDTLWVDNTGVLRIGSGIPREDGSVSDTSGTVVGTQTSTRAEKIILGERFDYETSLRHVLDAPVFDFKYRNGRFNGETFTGTTTDDAPIFGMDQGKSLNTVSAIGHLMQAVKAQQKQIELLQRDVAELKAAR